MNVLVGPIHFRNVYQAFHTFFKLGETAVVRQVGDNSFDLGVFWITTFDFDPWIFAQLLETQ